MTNTLSPDWLKSPADANALVPGVWPRTAHRNERGELMLGEVSTTSLASTFGTPLYVLDENETRSRATQIRQALDDACAIAGTRGFVYYASKAFLSGAVVKWMIDAGVGVDVASLGELELALAAGAQPANIGLHGNNKSDAELNRAAEVGVGSIVIDSADEVARVAAVAKSHGIILSVRLRVNTGVHASTHEYLATSREDQKFGVALSDAPAIVADIRSHPSLRFLGLHSHIGSQIFSDAGFIEAATRMLAVHRELLAGGPVPELNVGGGFGIAYTEADEPADVPTLVASLVANFARQCVDRGIDVPAIAIEPGRSIIGTPGVTLYTVGTIKPVEVSTSNGANVTRTYVSVDGGMSDNLRTAMYRADYSVTLANRTSDADPMLVRVVGKHCESGDIVIRDAYLPSDLRAGDILAVAATGAYCHSLSNNYNGLTRPAVVAVRGVEMTEIVRRETLADLLARDMQLGRNTL
ncbi:MAG: diaminopimelate decarboxylase [Microbacteriaceae bacterium]|nr:diaminopimelate decarboxylase [Microbacteriaceae bacterium]